MNTDKNLIRTDKKRNARYWDGIDAIIETMVYDVAKASVVELEEDALEDIISDGIVADVREMVIDYLKEKGGEFPFVNENM